MRYLAYAYQHGQLRCQMMMVMPEVRSVVPYCRLLSLLVGVAIIIFQGETVVSH